MNSDRLGPLGCLGGGIAVILLIGVLHALLFDNVNTGEVGIRKTFGQIEQKTLQPGFHYAFPLFQSIDKITTRAQVQQFAQIDAPTRQTQSIKVDGKVQYSVDPNKAFDLYIKVGPNDIEGKMIEPRLQTFLKEEMVRYDAYCENGTDTDTCHGWAQHREEIRAAVAQKIRSSLSTYGIDIPEVFLSNLDFADKNFKQAIEDRQTAKQAQAKAAVDAETAKIVAQGKAAANNTEKVTLTAEILQKMAIDKWNGTLPLYYGNGNASANPFFALPNKP